MSRVLSEKRALTWKKGILPSKARIMAATILLCPWSGGGECAKITILALSYFIALPRSARSMEELLKNGGGIQGRLIPGGGHGLILLGIPASPGFHDANKILPAAGSNFNDLSS